MDQFLADARERDDGRDEPPDAERDGEAGVLASCAELFVFYKKCLVQCAQLSTGEPLLELSGVFGAYLREYAQGVIMAGLPGPKSRDDRAVSWRVVRRATAALTTAEYCAETAAKLQEKLRERIRPGLRARVSLENELAAFRASIDTCVALLAAELKSATSAALGEMAKVNWQNVGRAADASPYVTRLTTSLRETVPSLRRRLASARKYFTQILIRFVDAFVPDYVQTIYGCGPLSTPGVEQLLLDAHAIKAFLLDLPNVGSEVKRGAPASYGRTVVRLMGKAEMVLKLVLSPAEGDRELSAWARQVAALLPGLPSAEFRRLLRLKAPKLPRQAVNSLAQLHAQSQQT